MASLPSIRTRQQAERLEAGDHLDQITFHARYLHMADDQKIELIGGIVIVPSPVSPKHGEYHAKLMGWLDAYSGVTPGTRVRANTTVILGPMSEPQPDAALIVDAAHGGQSTVEKDGHAVGPPELIVEIASSSAAYDLYEKRDDYERAGVLEYVVFLVRERRVRWFRLADGEYQEVQPDKDGLFTSEVFPGLWLNSSALAALDHSGLHRSLQEGLAHPTHAVFVERLRSYSGS